MARRVGKAFANKLTSEMIKGKNRNKRAQIQSEKKQIREYQRVTAKIEREKQAANKKAQRELYVSNKKNEADKRTEDILARFGTYNKIFDRALENNIPFQFANYKKTFKPNLFTYEKPYPKKHSPIAEIVPKESWTEKIFTSKKKKRLSIIESNEARIKKSEEESEKEILKYNSDKEKAYYIWKENEKLREKAIESHNRKIEVWKNSYNNREKEALILFVEELLKSNDYDNNLITGYRTRYVSDKEELKIEFDVKHREDIFCCEGYRYMIKADEFRPIKMKAKAINERTKNLMIELVGAIFAIVIKNDIGDFLSTVTVNGYHNNVCCITGKVEKELFLDKDFSTEGKIQLLENRWIEVYSQISKGIKPFD